MQTVSMGHTLDTLLEERAWLAGLARALVADAATAEDLAQETWLSALRHRGPLGAPRAWLAAVLRNHARQRARGTVRRDAREQEHAWRRSHDAPSSAEVVERFETQRTVAQAVADLDEPFRTTVLLHWFEGLAPIEIARREDVPAGTVRWRLHRAHELLRERLAGEYGEERWRAALAPLCVPFVRRAGAGGMLAAAAVVLVIGATVWFAIAALGGGGPSSPSAGRGATTAAAPAANGAAASARDEVRDAAPERPRGAIRETGVEAAAGRGDEFAVVRARLVDPDGAPIPDAQLELGRVGFGGFWVEDTAIAWIVPSAPVGQDGSVALSLRAPAAVIETVPEPFRPRPGEIWALELVASAPRFAPWIGPVHVGHRDDIDLGELVLRPASRLEGGVVGTDGRAVAGAEVVVELPPFTDRVDSYVAGGRVPSSDLRDETASFWGRGRYAIDAVPCGPAVVWARKDGHRSAWRLVDVGGAAVTTVDDLVLEPSTSPEVGTRPEFRELLVRVVEAGTGAPVTDAEVFHRVPDGGGSGAVMPDGTATIGWVPVGGRAPEIDLVVVDRSGRSAAERRRALDPTAGEVTIRLPLARTAEVVATGAAGEPVPGFAARWEQDEGTGYARFYARDEDGDGRVALVVPPCDAHVIVDAPGYREHVTERFAEGRFPGRLEVALAPLVGLSGRVVAEGEPVADAGVLVLRPTEPITSHGFRADYDSRGNWDVKTAADGTFRLDLEEREPLRLLVRADGFAPALSAPLDYDPVRGLGDVEIELSAGGTVEGTVRDADGDPVPRAIVALNDFLGRPLSVRAGPDGRFRFERVRPATYELHPVTAMIADGSTMTAPLGVDDQVPVRADVAVREGETVVCDVVRDRCELRVRLPGADDLRGWTAKLIQPHDGRTLDADDAVGRDRAFRLATAWTGRYLVQVRSAGGPLGRVEIRSTVALVEGANDLVIDAAFAAFEGDWPTGALDGRLELVQRRGEVTLRVPVEPDPMTGRFRVPLAPTGTVELEQRVAGERRVLGVLEVR